MASFDEKLDSETKDVINYLKSRSEVCDFRIEEFAGVSSAQLNDWEAKNSCNLPNDLKSFYLNHNGMLIEWKFKQESSAPISLGHIQINSLRDLTRVGSFLSKDFREPSLFDLEEIQTPPEALISSSISSFSSSSFISLSAANLTSQPNIERKKPPTQNELSNENNKNSSSDSNANNNEWLTNEDEEDNESNNSAETSNEKPKGDNNEDGSNRLKKKIQRFQTLDYSLLPHFDESSRNFELDNCGGYGKICLVYRNSKTGSISSEQNAEIWFLDRSLQWHFLTNSFRNYYRLLLAHLGLPQWQMLFTDDGLPPFLYQWYYMFAPGRILIHDDAWKKLNFLSMFDNSASNVKKSQTQKTNGSTTTLTTTSTTMQNKKIEFSKLFEENKISKSKSQNAINQNGNVNPAGSPNSNNGHQTDKSNTSLTSKPKSRITVRK